MKHKNSRVRSAGGIEGKIDQSRHWTTSAAWPDKGCLPRPCQRWYAACSGRERRLGGGDCRI